MTVPRIDLIEIVIPDRPSTPFADLVADPFLSALWLPTITVNRRRTWPFRPMRPRHECRSSVPPIEGETK